MADFLSSIVAVGVWLNLGAVGVWIVAGMVSLARDI